MRVKHGTQGIWRMYLGGSNMVKWDVPVKTIQNTIETHLPYVKGGIWNLAFKHQIPPLLGRMFAKDYAALVQKKIISNLKWNRGTPLLPP